MEFPIKFDTAKSGWSIVYIEGSQVEIKKEIYISFSNSADPDEMPHDAVLMKCRMMRHFIWVFTVCQRGAQWLSGRVLGSRQRGSGFKHHWRHCIVVFEQDTFTLA